MNIISWVNVVVVVGGGGGGGGGTCSIGWCCCSICTGGGTIGFCCCCLNTPVGPNLFDGLVIVLFNIAVVDAALLVTAALNDIGGVTVDDCGIAAAADVDSEVGVCVCCWLMFNEAIYELENMRINRF